MLIRVFGEDGDLKIEVIDNGKGMSNESMVRLEESSEGTYSRFSGMGVRNVHERIHRLFGKPYGIKLYSEEGLYTKVELSFPGMGSGK